MDGLLAEFRDHKVVRGSTVPPAARDGHDEDADEEGGDGTEWIWITLGMQALQQVLEEVEEGDE